MNDKGQDKAEIAFDSLREFMSKAMSIGRDGGKLHGLIEDARRVADDEDDSDLLYAVELWLNRRVRANRD